MWLLYLSNQTLHWSLRPAPWFLIGRVWSKQSSVHIFSWILVWRTGLVTRKKSWFTWKSDMFRWNWSATVCINQNYLTHRFTENAKGVLFCWKLNCLFQAGFNNFFRQCWFYIYIGSTCEVTSTFKYKKSIECWKIGNPI